EAHREGINAFNGIRYRPKEFGYIARDFSPQTLGWIGDVAEIAKTCRTPKTGTRHMDTLMLTLARAILLIDRDLELLDATDLFVAYAYRVGGTEEYQIELMRKTISDSVFDEVFPELRQFDERLATVRLSERSEQAAFWAGSARDMATGRNVRAVGLFSVNGITIDRMLRNLIDLGSVAVPAMVDVLGELVSERQLEPDELVESGGLTRECVFAMRLIAAIIEIRLVDWPSVDRLVELHRLLVSDVNNPGPIAGEIWRLLCRVRPLVFSADG
ncbi:MAG: hypothetical protein FWD57_13165, partial [Polyangiaceae bacterium]|nr:hypothetical protein [Polyangiaceae bacterium]